MRHRRAYRLGVATLWLAAAPALAQMTPLHQPGAVSGPIVESEQAMKVTGTIQCWCGGCVNQTLHECTCGLAAGERARVAAALAEGRTPDQLIAAYVAEHGEQVRLVPERRGLNLIGWAVPFAAALAGLLALTMVLAGWRRRVPAVSTGRGPGAAPGPPTSADQAAYRARIERDLRESGR